MQVNAVIHEQTWPNLSEPSVRYGCVFCKTDREGSVAESMEAQNRSLKAAYVSQISHKSVQGIKSTVQQITMPGYVYFQTNSYDPPDLRFIQDSIRLLRPAGKSWTLWGWDEWFAKWIVENQGVIGMSKARINADNRVEAVHGPLKTLEAYMKRVDKHRRGAQVVLPFHDREVTLWLAYELVE